MEQKILALVELLKETVEGKCAIALAGAHAKGAADASSDIDLYIFAERPKPWAERKALIASVADPETTPWVGESFDVAPWGGEMDFMYQGTPVEAVGRTLTRMDQVVEDSLKGRYEIIPATWTSNGYYTFIYLCELSFLKPVWDPDGVLAAYQAKVAAYPAPLRRAIMTDFLSRAGTWMGNFHYESAVKRKDVLFTAPIVLHTVLDMVQVVFALNRAYFTGDKKLEATLAKLPICPDALRPGKLELLLSAPKDAAVLEEQSQLLQDAHRQLRMWVEEALAEK